MGLYATAFLGGATIMILETLGFRLLPPYFGYSTHVWGALLGVVMVALALGYLGGGLLADRRPHPAMLYLMVLVAAGYSVLLLLAYPAVLRLSVQFGSIPGSFVAALLLFAIPMAALSTVSPFVIRLLAGEGEVGGATGKVYAISTVGSVAGTCLTAFYLIPTIGTRGSLIVSCLILALVGGVGLAASGALERRGTLDPPRQ